MRRAQIAKDYVSIGSCSLPAVSAEREVKCHRVTHDPVVVFQPWHQAYECGHVRVAAPGDVERPLVTGRVAPQGAACRAVLDSRARAARGGGPRGSHRTRGLPECEVHLLDGALGRGRWVGRRCGGLAAGVPAGRASAATRACCAPVGVERARLRLSVPRVGVGPAFVVVIAPQQSGADACGAVRVPPARGRRRRGG
jgi:hypothetical protein